jgi:hypothetical protein
MLRFLPIVGIAEWPWSVPTRYLNRELFASIRVHSRFENFSAVGIASPNQAASGNGAVASLFHAAHCRRAVPALRRSTNALTAGMDWPRKSAKGTKESQLVRSRSTSAGRIDPVPFAPLALFRGYPDFLVSTFRARRSSNQTRQAMPVDGQDCVRTRSARHACAVRSACGRIRSSHTKGKSDGKLGRW